MNMFSNKHIDQPKRVVVVGGGFGGLNVAKALEKNHKVKVILIDQRNHHLFQPLLYQVATAGLNPGDIAVPIRAQFSAVKNIEVHWGCAQYVDLKNQKLRVVDVNPKYLNTEVDLHYDYLVLACGATHSYFGHPEWEDHAPGLKTLEQATEIRRRILSAFERAENESDPVKQNALLTFVVVGGGPTGVELAGAIADISRTVLIKDFRYIDPKKARVVLIEAGPRVLSAFAPSLSKKTEKALSELGVEVLTNMRVQAIDEDGVSLGDKRIFSKSVVWAAGVQATQIKWSETIAMDKAGRVIVEKDLSVPSYENVFVIGDMALVKNGADDFVPGLAPAAIQEGKFAAKTILRSIDSKPRHDFKYVDKGIMATIGKNKAVVQAKAFRVTGVVAWLMWLFIHIFYLIGFKNRVSVLVQWTWSYIFSKRGARLITERQWKLKK